MPQRNDLDDALDKADGNNTTRSVLQPALSSMAARTVSDFTWLSLSQMLPAGSTQVPLAREAVRRKVSLLHSCAREGGNSLLSPDCH